MNWRRRAVAVELLLYCQHVKTHEDRIHHITGMYDGFPSETPLQSPTYSLLIRISPLSRLFSVPYLVFVNLTSRKTKADTSLWRSEIFSTFRVAICHTTSKFNPKKCSFEWDSRAVWQTWISGGYCKTQQEPVWFHHGRDLQTRVSRREKMVPHLIIFLGGKG